MANEVSKRRDTTNNVFVTINLAIVAGLTSLNTKWLILFIGITLNVLWWLLIRNYKDLNTAKFSIIMDIEKKLGFRPLGAEWNRLKKNSNYINATLLENAFPIIFSLSYIIYLLYNNRECILEIIKI